MESTSSDDRREPPEPADTEQDVGGRGGEGWDQAESTPPIAEEGEQQTAHPAPDDEVGVPDDPGGSSEKSGEAPEE